MKLLLTFLFLALGVLHSALASFHLWDIDEVYSTADGSVQFVRLSSKSDGQGLLTGHALTFTGPGGPRTRYAVKVVRLWMTQNLPRGHRAPSLLALARRCDSRMIHTA